jgi:hypothetical protein
VAGGKMKEKIIQDEVNKIIKSFYMVITGGE